MRDGLPLALGALAMCMMSCESACLTIQRGLLGRRGVSSKLGRNTGVPAWGRGGPWRRSKMLQLVDVRGGADDEEEEEEGEEVDDDAYGTAADEEEDEELEDLAYDAGVTEDDFNDGSLWSMVKKEYHRTPLISKGYMWASLTTTLMAYVFNGNNYPTWLLLDWKPTLTRLQIWRPITSFLYMGNFGLNYLLQAHFMWTYMSSLERLRSSEPAEFLMMLLFGAGLLLLGSQLLGFQPHFLGHNLSCYLVYIWARHFEGQDVDIMGLFHLPAHLLPWFFVAQGLVLEKELPLPDLLGIAVGHLYHYGSTRKVIRAPPFLRQLYDAKWVKQHYKRYRDEQM